MTAIIADLQRLALQAPITVDCDFCGQPRGTGCRTSGGWYPLVVHAVRRHAVDHLSQEEQAAAVLAWQAELGAARAAARSAWADIDRQVPAGAQARLGPVSADTPPRVAVLPVADLGMERARRRPAASQCGECVEGGYGPPCLKHFLDAEAAYERGLDV